MKDVEQEEVEPLTGEDEEERRIADMGKPTLGEHVKLEVIIEESYEFKVNTHTQHLREFHGHWSGILISHPHSLPTHTHTHTYNRRTLEAHTPHRPTHTPQSDTHTHTSQRGG